MKEFKGNQFGKEAHNNRNKAIAEGKKYYDGSRACKHCGSYEKFVSNSACRPCNIKRNRHKLDDAKLMAPYRTNEKGNNATRRWRSDPKNLEKLRAQYQRGYEKDRGAIQAKYRASKRNQTPEDADLKLIHEFYVNCPEGYEVDHIIPISKGGLHHQDNLQYLTIFENRSKGNKIL